MKLLTTALIFALAAPTFAGGLVIVEDAYEAEPAQARKVPAFVWVALGAVVVAAIAGGGSDVCNGDEVPVVPEQPSGGC